MKGDLAQPVHLHIHTKGAAIFRCASWRSVISHVYQHKKVTKKNQKVTTRMKGDSLPRYSLGTFTSLQRELLFFMFVSNKKVLKRTKSIKKYKRRFLALAGPVNLQCNHTKGAAMARQLPLPILFQDTWPSIKSIIISQI